ncbi:MAG: nucleotidyltransferase domain-containing protein [Oscillospiraceae bacterium]|jgi:predicted nucleotidyltransferase|nr:nucleotidyltransferase domain-containing protein [Oscillospiraceae bacterium]
MVYTIDELRRKLHPIFRAAPVYKAILFGSYAKGEAEESSDVDIYLDSHGELRGFDFCGVLEDMVVALDKEVDLLDARAIRQGTRIESDIFEGGVMLYER